MPTRVHRLSCSLIGALTVFMLGACAGTPARHTSSGPMASLDVRELNIVDEHGQARIRIGAPLPDPKGLRRKVTAYGLQFMSASGEEVGGLAMLDEVGIRGLCIDSEEGYEAMCVSLVKGEPEVTLGDSSDNRIFIGVRNGIATVELKDTRGKPHLRLEVDKDGRTRVEGVQ